MKSKKIILRNKKVFNKLAFLIPIVISIMLYGIIDNFKTNDPWRIGFSIILGLFCVLSLILFINAIKQSKKTTAALIIDKNGITDNISIANAGKIKWNEIIKFEILKSAGHPHLFVFVKDPEKYINNKSWLKKGMITKLNIDKGSPIAIDLNQVQINPTELLELMREMKTTFYK